jgi:hypothetical protein
MLSPFRSAVATYRAASAYVDTISQDADDDTFNRAVDAAHAAMMAVVIAPVTDAEFAEKRAFMLGKSFSGAPVLELLGASDD